MTQFSNDRIPEWTNPYIPDHNQTGSDELDDLMHILAASLVERLDELNCDEVLNRLVQIPEPELQKEAILLKEEIERLRNRVSQL